MKKVKKGSIMFIILISFMLFILIYNMMYRSAIYKAEIAGTKDAYIDMANDSEEE